MKIQFRLRTLMIVVALLAVACAYVGRQLKWIADRHEAAKGHSLIDSVEEQVGPDLVFKTRTQSAPWPLGWLGEDGHVLIGYSESAPSSEIERLKELFPEANVSYDPFLPYSASDH